MSKPAENRWRASASQPQQSSRDRSSLQPQQVPNRSKSSADTNATPSTVAKSNTPSPAPQPQQQQQQQRTVPNAWTDAAAAERSRSASAARAASGAVKSTGSTGAASAGGQQGEMYVAVGGFNADGVREYLRKSTQDSVAGDSERVARWKAPGDTAGTRQTGPWGQKASMMTNGSDFWVQLKKQVTAKEQGIGG